MKYCLIALISTCFLAGLFSPGMAMNPASDSLIYLDSSEESNIQWKVRAVEEVENYNRIFSPDFDDEGWVTGTVPGTVFGSYVEQGLEKNPNFGDNIYHVDQSKYNRDFWYRTEFELPQNWSSQYIWLNSEGINRKADIYVNGHMVGQVDGFMDPGDFNIAQYLNRKDTNVLTIKVYYPREPIPNYASPTYISSASWDWMPDVPGMNMGVTDNLYLKQTGSLTIEYPWIRTRLPSLDTANVSLITEVANHTSKEQKAVLSAIIEPGTIQISREVTIAPNTSQKIELNKADFESLQIVNPKLWWPNGYGEQNLYDINLNLSSADTLFDTARETFGIREYTYDTEDDVLHISVNGTRVFVKGGNWGMSEYMLRTRGKEYDRKVRLHKEMNFNMIRNWIGSTTDEEFYEACDKYGIMIWDDFWLNSHPNLPRDIYAFNKNVVEKIKRVRNHPSIAIWSGENEGVPLAPLNKWITENVRVFDGGDRRYQPSSNTGALTGSGPWTNMRPSQYFTKYPNGFGGNDGWGMRSEIGTAVFTTFESFKKFIPKEDWWPRNEMWDKHFFGPSAANASPDVYQESINNRYGKATGIRDFTRKAQLLNIETNKAMFEGWQHNMWDDASGILIWMSQSAYPSFVWQTYDYYYDLTGAYWGAKKASEPIHIQWSAADNSVKVVNTTSDKLKHLNAEAKVFNKDGSEVESLRASETSTFSNPSSAQKVFTLGFYKNSYSYDKQAVASSTSGDAKLASAVTDGNSGSRWTSEYTDDEWVYIDLGNPRDVSKVRLSWEAAYGKSYKIQVSNDAEKWHDVYSTTEGDGDVDEISFEPVEAQYVRMKGRERGTEWGYSLWEFEVFGSQQTDLSDVHFIKLKLKDANGKLLSDNFYWRSTNGLDYTGLNSMAQVDLTVSSEVNKDGDTTRIKAEIRNPEDAPAIAFVTRVKVVNSETGEKILPVDMNSNYFSLLPGESERVNISFTTDLLKGATPKLIVEPYNNGL